MLYSTEGIILKQTKYNESDKILTIFSKDRGKIQAIAKGARKHKSSLRAGSQIFGYSKFILYKGRGMYNISQAENIESFYHLRENLEKLAYGTYIIELVDSAIAEEESNEKLFGLLIKTLKILSKLDRDYSKYIRAFELKYISFIGYKPHIDRCIVCNQEPEDKMIFSIANGGIVCYKCIRQGLYGQTIDRKTLRIMKFLLYSKLDGLEEIEIDDNSLEIIKNILINYIMVHIDKKHFKSLEFLNMIQK